MYLPSIKADHRPHHHARAGMQSDQTLEMQMHHLGYYEHEEDAARAYDIAVRRFRGRNAPTNLPPRPGRPPAALKLSSSGRGGGRGRGARPDSARGTPREEDGAQADEDEEEEEAFLREQDTTAAGEATEGGNEENVGSRMAGAERGRGRGK